MPRVEGVSAARGAPFQCSSALPRVPRGTTKEPSSNSGPSGSSASMFYLEKRHSARICRFSSITHSGRPGSRARGFPLLLRSCGKALASPSCCPYDHLCRSCVGCWHMRAACVPLRRTGLTKCGVSESEEHAGSRDASVCSPPSAGPERSLASQDSRV